MKWDGESSSLLKLLEAIFGAMAHQRLKFPILATRTGSGDMWATEAASYKSGNEIEVTAAASLLDPEALRISGVAGNRE